MLNIIKSSKIVTKRSVMAIYGFMIKFLINNFIKINHYLFFKNGSNNSYILSTNKGLSNGSPCL